MKKEFSKPGVDRLIKKIICFKKSTYNDNPHLSNLLMGDLGELYVYKKLFKFNPELRAGQSGYDILLKKLDKRIEVRASTWKEEKIFPDKTPYWGWRVVNRDSKGKIQEIKYDYLVCVGLSENWSKPKFYIFTKQEAKTMPEKDIGRFNAVGKSVVLFKNTKVAPDIYKKCKKQQLKVLTTFEVRFNKNPRKYQNHWGRIR